MALHSAFKKQRRRTFTVAASLTAAVLLVSACSSGGSDSGSGGSSVQPVPTSAAGVDQSVIDAAKKEGSVYVYSDIPKNAQAAITAGFNKVYPNIKITFDRRAGLTTIVPAQVNSGKQVGDMYLTGGDVSFITSNAAILKPIASKELQSDTWTPYVLDKGLGVQFYFAPNAIGWNTSAVPDGFKKLDDLATRDSSLVIGMADPNLSTGVRGILMQTEDSMGDDWMSKTLHSAKLYDSSTALTQGLASGEIDVAWPVLGTYLQDLKGQGAPIDYVLQDPPTSTRATETILSNAPHPNAAQLLADFLLSKSGQQSSAAGTYSPYPDLSGTAGTAKPDDKAADLTGFSEADQQAFLQKFKTYTGS